MRKNARKARSKVSPVALALVLDSTRKLVGEITIKAHLTPDGMKDLDLIAQFAFIIGLGAEVSLALGDDLARTKRLHSALRTLVGMAVDGGHWQAAQSARLHDLTMEGNWLFLKHPKQGWQAYPGALELSDRIGSGKATMGDVAGAEIYAEAA